MRGAPTIAVLFLAGCGASHTEPDAGVIAEACGGDRPTSDECIFGAAWAECGGEAGDPVLACIPGPGLLPGGCRWFANGCVPDSFEVSPCPADDVCCFDGFPYPGEYGMRSSDPTLLIEGWGTRPWDRTRERNVDVSVAPLAIGDPLITCSAGAPSDGPCDPSLSTRQTSRRDVLTIVASTTSCSILCWWLTTEVIRDADGTLHARACRTQTTDAQLLVCRDREPLCAVEGTLVLERFPDPGEPDVHAELSVIFADGLTIDLRL